MFFTNFCSTALIYLIFIIIHVVLEMKEQNTKGAILQLLTGIMMTLLLQVLCMRGMTILSWIIVFIPFIFYTYMMVLLYNVFGVEPSEKVKRFLVTQDEYEKSEGEQL